MAQMSPLRQRMIEDLTIRNLSPETQRSYVHHVSKFSRYFGRSPDQLGYEEVRAYQAHLVGRKVSWGSLNQTVCALRFFYGVTLGRSDLPERIASPRTPRKLPVVLSADEVIGFLQAVKGTRNRIALMASYGAGLRAAEAARLKVADIDSAQMVIRVEQGKRPGMKQPPSKRRLKILSPPRRLRSRTTGRACSWWRIIRQTVKSSRSRSAIW